MKRTLLNPVFLVCLSLATINQVLEKGFGLFIPIAHSYLDDLLCLPIVLTIGLSMYRYFKPEYRLTLVHMLPVLVVYSVYFEWYLPQFSTTATSDPIDIVMYVLGLTVFGYFINRNDELRLDVTKS
jgi:hypothetical protein